MNGFVYIGCDKSGLFKIGISNNYKKRFGQLKTGNPFFNFMAVFSSENPSEIETEIHNKFSEKRFWGEWFSLDADDIKSILDDYTNSVFSVEEIQKSMDEVMKNEQC